VVPADFLLSLHLHLFERFADNSQDLLYRAGFDQGLQDMTRLVGELGEKFGRGTFDLWQADAKFILGTWWESLQQAGWGRCEFDCGALTRGVTLVTLENSPIAAALGRAEHPICHFLAGLFAGVMSFYERAERHATELECRSCGAGACRFLIAAGGEVDAAEGWRQQGVPAAEILRRLR
jgi:predicted hydrocarbon binding protein